MGSNFTQFGFGPVIFFALTAIFSVAMLTLVLCLSIRAIVISPERKAPFTVLFFIAAFFGLIFFYAIVRYQWLGGSTAYDGLYHSIGYFGSIILAIFTIAMASNNKTGSAKLVLLSLGVPLGFLVLNAFVGLFLAPFTSLMGGATNDSISYVIGFLYASIQIVMPLLYYFFIRSVAAKQRELGKDLATLPSPTNDELQQEHAPQQSTPLGQ